MSPAPVARHLVRVDFERVVDDLGRTPSTTEYTERGAYTAPTVANKFGDGSYTDALRALGYEPPNTPPDIEDIPADAVAEDFDRVVETLGRVPSSVEYRDHGKYSSWSVSKKFDDSSGEGYSYNCAVRNLGYEPQNTASSSAVAKDDLLRDLGSVIDTLGRVPTPVEYNTYGDHCARTFAEQFSDGAFNDSLYALGYTPQNPKKDQISPESVEQDVVRVAGELNGVPTQPEYKKHGEYPISWVKEFFGDGSYPDAIEALGYEYPYSISTENLRKDLANVAEKLRREPTREDYETHGTFPARTVEDRFDHPFSSA